MELGYSITSAYDRELLPDAVAGELVDRASTAAAAGYDFVQVGDHHVRRDKQYVQNVPAAARLTAEFDRVAVMCLLPLWDPLLLAEQLGTVDAFAGEFDLWCALGWREEEFAAFGVPTAERAARFEESLALLRALWAGDDVDFDGEFYEVSGVTVAPKADPARVCIGGGAEPAVRRAGRLGDAWVANADETEADIERKAGWAAEAGGGEVLARRDALVLEDGTEARALARKLLADGYRGWDHDAPVLVGDPTHVATDLDRLSRLGVDGVAGRPMSEERGGETLRGVAEARELMAAGE